MAFREGTGRIQNNVSILTEVMPPSDATELATAALMRFIASAKTPLRADTLDRLYAPVAVR